MNKFEVTVKTFNSPFSFFCAAVADEAHQAKNIKINDTTAIQNKSLTLSDTNHGQYVAVMYNNNWVRGIVSMESLSLIWLIDHGVYIRPVETVYVDLPAEYKKLPSHIFEASIHGVTPVGTVVDEFYEFKHTPILTWGSGASETAYQLMATAHKTYFVPIAMVTTKNNDVVLGDLYLEYQGKGIVNIIDELQSAPIFMERRPEIYLKNLSSFYSSRRHHRACLLKPELAANLPTITDETNLIAYSAICDQITPYSQKYDSDSEDGSSSVTYIENVKDGPKSSLKLTPSEIEQYANEFVVIGGKEVSVLTILINKARDLFLCERDKDVKSLGRGYTRWAAIKN